MTRDSMQDQEGAPQPGSLHAGPPTYTPVCPSAIEGAIPPQTVTPPQKKSAISVLWGDVALAQSACGRGEVGPIAMGEVEVVQPYPSYAEHAQQSVHASVHARDERSRAYTKCADCGAIRLELDAGGLCGECASACKVAAEAGSIYGLPFEVLMDAGIAATDDPQTVVHKINAQLRVKRMVTAVAPLVLTPMQQYATMTNGDAPDMLGVVPAYPQRDCEIDDGKSVPRDDVQPKYTADIDKIDWRSMRGVVGTALANQFPAKDFPKIEVTYKDVRTEYNIAAMSDSVERASHIKPNDPLVGW